MTPVKPDDLNQDSEMQVLYHKGLNTRSILEKNFFENLAKIGVKPGIASNVQPTELVNAANEASTPSVYEEALITLCGIRDDLVDAFTQCSSNQSIAALFTDYIRRVERAVSRLGGEIEPFNPLSHMSGLGSGESSHSQEEQEKALLENALRVAERTKSVYKLFPIQNIAVKLINGLPAVQLSLQGTDEKGSFQAVGQVQAKSDFAGNEAIDYVRRGGSELLAVKALRLGRWVDVSDKFHIKVASSPAQK